MSSTNPFFNSLSELELLAKQYKTRPIDLISSQTDPVYNIADISEEELNNITNFVFNSIIKDTEVLDAAETENSKMFASYLKKYFNLGLSNSDIIALKEGVDIYNSNVFNSIYSNSYSYIYEVFSNDANSLYNRIVKQVKTRLEIIINEYIAFNSANESKKLRVSQWYGKTDTINPDWLGDDDSEESINFSEKTITVQEFYNSYLNKGNVIETLVFISILSYLNNSDASNRGLIETSLVSGQYVVNRTSNVLESEDFFVSKKDDEIFKYGSAWELPIKKVIIPQEVGNVIDELTSSVLINAQTNTFKNRYQQSIRIKLDISGDNTSEEFLFLVPIFSYEVETTNNINNPDTFRVLDIYNIIPSNIVNATAVSYSNLYQTLFNNLYGFLNVLDYKNIGASSSVYQRNLLYFFDNDLTVNRSINNIIRESAELFFNKDFMYYEVEATEDSNLKISASITETSKALTGQQLVFFDISGVDFSSTKKYINPFDANESRTELVAAQNVFSSLLGPQLDPGPDLKLSFKLLYKELNPVYRSNIMADVQEFIFTRILQADSELVSEKLDGIDLIYRSHAEEINSVFLLSDAFYNYRYFYCNIYNFRAASESELVGYYIGDDSLNSAFLLNYGSKQNHKREIDNFLTIFKTTRDYYYKVLLNKSFIQDDEYKLYEKLFITFVAIERFLTSKIDNIHDIDFFNDTDIFNFLQSYGLEILNRTQFFVGSKNYKLNIIKYYNDLVRKKGSKDVIDVLMKVFDLGDVEIDINKFLLVEKTNQTNDSTSTIQLTLNDDKISIGSYISPNKITQEMNKTFFDLFRERGIIDNNDFSVSIKNNGLSIDTRENVSSYFTNSIKLILNEDEYYAMYIGNKKIEKSAPLGISIADLLTGFLLISSGSYNIYADGVLVSQYANGVLVGQSLQLDDSLVLKESSLSIELVSQNDVLKIKYGNIFTDFYNSNGTVKTIQKVLADLGVIEKEIRLPFSVSISNANYKSDILLSSLLTNVGNTITIILKVANLLIVETKTLLLEVSRNTRVGNSNLVFVETDYSSDNETRDIFNNLPGGFNYDSFINQDPYWTIENVPEQLLLEKNLNAVETKYLSLILTENIYKKYIMARYMFSAIDYLSEKMIIGSTESNNLLKRVILDSGDQLFGDINIYDYFDVIKIHFKSIIRLYELKFNLSNPPESGKYYGINKNANAFDKVITDLGSLINNFQTEQDKFLKTTKRNEALVVTDVPLFDPYEKANPIDWVNYTSFSPLNNLKLELQKNKKDNGTFTLNTIGEQIKNVIFTNHKTEYGKAILTSYKNSGDYVLDTLVNMNLIRIGNQLIDSPKTDHEIGQEMWLYFLSNFFDTNYEPINESLVADQINNKRIDRSELYYNALEKMIQFPIDMIDGLLHPTSKPELELTKDFANFAETVFNDVYLTDQNPVNVDFGTISQLVSAKVLSIVPFIADPTYFTIENIDIKIEDLSNKLALAIDGLNTLFISEQFMQFSFTLPASEVATLGFVKTATEIFLSYTATLYRTEYKRSYDTVGESVPLSEDIKHTLNSSKSDMVFYDEKVIIERVGG